MTDDIDWGAALEESGPVDPIQFDQVEVIAPPPAVKVFDTTPAAQRALEFKDAIDQMREQSKTITIIRDTETEKVALRMAASAKKLAKQLENLRHGFVDPHFEYKKKVDGFFKLYMDPLKEMEARLARLIGNFRQFQETERRKLEAQMKKAAAETAKAQAKEAEEAAKEGVDYTPAQVPVPMPPDVPAVVRTEEGSASQRLVWTFEVEDESKVPRNYLVVDEKLIRADIKSGIRVIPGVRIYQDYVTNIRTT